VLNNILVYAFVLQLKSVLSLLKIFNPFFLLQTRDKRVLPRCNTIACDEKSIAIEIVSSVHATDSGEPRHPPQRRAQERARVSVPSAMIIMS
jgi:hypothetical protein